MGVLVVPAAIIWHVQGVAYASRVTNRNPLHWFCALDLLLLRALVLVHETTVSSFCGNILLLVFFNDSTMFNDFDSRRS